MASEPETRVPQLTGKRLKKARRLVGDGKLVAALNVFEEIIQFDPRGGSVWLHYADVLKDLGRFKEAMAAYEKALQFAPENRRCFVLARIGILMEESESIAEAGEYYRRAVDSLREPAAWVKVLYGKNLATQGRYQDAEKVLIEATELESSERDEAYLNLAMLYRSTKRYNEARQMAAKALDVNPRYLPARKLMTSLKELNEGKH